MPWFWLIRFLLGIRKIFLSLDVCSVIFFHIPITVGPESVFFKHEKGLLAILDGEVQLNDS